MPEELIVFPLVPDLPEDWVIDSTITPNGTEVGLTERYGYNYLMKMVNKSLKAVNQVDARITTSIANLEAIPKGIVAMWAGELINIPTGWKLCDGLEGRPNMLARFIRGIQTSVTNPGATGGADSLTLSAANMPNHKHGMGTHTHTETAHAHAMTHSHTVTGTLGTAGDHYHWYRDYSTHEDAYVPSYKEAGMSYIYFNYQMATGSTNMYVPVMATANHWSTSDGTKNAGTHSHTFSGSATSYSGNTGTASGGNTGACAVSDTESTGDGQSLDIRPAYYEIAFIIKA